uniref:Uncharacterized protein n=1 Tax=Panagrolaimus sp. JU765 TaxID=591449 RepID=A0AC34QML8_9BILA
MKNYSFGQDHPDHRPTLQNPGLPVFEQPTVTLHRHFPIARLFLGPFPAHLLHRPPPEDPVLQLLVGVDAIIFDIGLFHSLWGIQGCVAEHLDGGYGRFGWCICHSFCLLFCLPFAFVTRPKPFFLWPLLIQQSAYGIGLLILSLAALPRILPTFMGDLSNAPLFAILFYLFGALMNYWLLYVYYHWYWHVESEYDSATKLKHNRLSTEIEEADPRKRPFRKTPEHRANQRCAVCKKFSRASNLNPIICERVNVSGKIGQLEEMLKKLKDENGAFASENEGLRRETQFLRQVNANYQSNVGEMQKRIDNDRRQIQNLTSMIAERDFSLAARNEEISKLRHQKRSSKRRSATSASEEVDVEMPGRRGASRRNHRRPKKSQSEYSVSQRGTTSNSWTNESASASSPRVQRSTRKSLKATRTATRTASYPSHVNNDSKRHHKPKRRSKADPSTSTQSTVSTGQTSGENQTSKKHLKKARRHQKRSSDSKFTATTTDSSSRKSENQSRKHVKNNKNMEKQEKSAKSKKVVAQKSARQSTRVPADAFKTAKEVRKSVNARVSARRSLQADQPSTSETSLDSTRKNQSRRSRGSATQIQKRAPRKPTTEQESIKTSLRPNVRRSSTQMAAKI